MISNVVSIFRVRIMMIQMDLPPPPLFFKLKAWYIYELRNKKINKNVTRPFSPKSFSVRPISRRSMLILKYIFPNISVHRIRQILLPDFTSLGTGSCGFENLLHTSGFLDLSQTSYLYKSFPTSPFIENHSLSKHRKPFSFSQRLQIFPKSFWVRHFLSYCPLMTSIILLLPENDLWESLFSNGGVLTIATLPNYLIFFFFPQGQ